MSGSTVYLNHFGLTRTPFRQQPDPEIFYAEARRAEILQNLCVDIIGGKPLVKLTGGEGTGKTLLYILLARKLGIKKFEVVCLDHPVGSFDDLLRTICRALNGCGTQGEERDELPGQGYLAELQAVLAERNEAGQRVVLLIDESDQLFLATLERLIRLVGEIGPKKLLQVVLIGRQELDRNLQRLSSYCDLADIHAGYALEPLSVEETGSYLCYRLVQAGISEKKAKEVFSAGAIAALFERAKGNLSMTNLLAEEALTGAYETGMFQVCPEVITPRLNRSQNNTVTVAPMRTWLRSSRRLIIMGAGLFLALLFVFLRPEGQEVVVNGTPDNISALEEQGKESLPPPPRELAAPAETVEAEPPPVSNERAVDQLSITKDQEAEAIDSSESTVAPTVAEPAETSQPVPDGAVSRPEVAAYLLPNPEPAIVQEGSESSIDQGEHSSAAKATDKVVLLAQTTKKKVSDGPVEDIESADDLQKGPPQVFAERLRASSRWRTRSGFTIQLMALASKDAEDNFKRLLGFDRYAEIQEQLYLVRKEFPPTLFVYYGYYASMKEARQGRDALPDFLLKNRPYPLSIEQAVQKAGN